jgi:hypothetical protein
MVWRSANNAPTPAIANTNMKTTAQATGGPSVRLGELTAKYTITANVNRATAMNITPNTLKIKLSESTMLPEPVPNEEGGKGRCWEVGFCGKTGCPPPAAPQRTQ